MRNYWYGRNRRAINTRRAGFSVSLLTRCTSAHSR